jgi:colanic acid biosynthesis glycosyl transferase WcaI
VIPTGADARAPSSPSARQAWRRARELEDRFVVLYAGSFNETYGLDTVLDAARELEGRHPEIVLVFAGDGRLRPRIERAARASSNVRYAGALARSDLAGALAGADCGLVTLADVPLLSAMMPGKLFEYMAAALPVVSAMRGQPGLVVEASGAGRVATRAEPGAIARVIVDLAGLPASERREMGERGREWIIENVPADRAGSRVAEVAAEAAASARGSRGRLARSAARATRDVVLRRSARALARRYAPEAIESTIRAAFHGWMESEESRRPSGRVSLAVPAHLSAPGAETAERG